MKLILCFALLTMAGCSGGDDAEEPVKAEGDASEESTLADADNTKDAGTSEEENIVEDTADDTVEVDEAEPAMPAPAATEPAGFTGPKTWKYVTAFALKVRSAPDKDTSSVVRYVKKADKIEVVIDGEWAKLGNGEYISANRLSDNDPAIKPRKARKNKAGKAK